MHQRWNTRLALLAAFTCAAGALSGSASAQLFARPAESASRIESASQPARVDRVQPAPSGRLQGTREPVIDDTELVTARQSARDASLERARARLRETQRAQVGMNN